ncbi:hypothetical protein [Hymenobacter sp. IS2118]|uniref:hypothetical protein n=1 Tax=Hymenobacter sp. IS2118 TaxID=1505605 RepID=UPI000A47EFD3|nr:hypothetical protein [Hymenobacter sp. IS2118]
MMRSRLISQFDRGNWLRLAGFLRKGSRPLLLLALLLMLGSGPEAGAQPAAGPGALRAAPDSAATVAKPASDLTTVWAVLAGVGIGVLGAWLWARRSKPTAAATAVVLPASEIQSWPVQRKPAENVPKAPPQTTVPAAPAPAVPKLPAAVNSGKPAASQSMREMQGAVAKPAGKGAGASKKNKTNFNSRSSAPTNPPAASGPKTAMNPTPLPLPPTDEPDSIQTGQTVEWPAPTSTPPAIEELIDASAAPAPAASNGPIHYYAPAPDVPSIEHRKLSPNPLPQMPLLITLAHAGAGTAQYAFSPQADQSRIIGNGVRELKEFFAFELPPTEQFTTITNLAAGKLEKREDTWHVVEKAEIALR